MRFANHDGLPVVIDGDEVIELVDRDSPVDFVGAIAAWPTYRDALATRPRRAFDPKLLGPPVPRPGKVVGAPVNYLDHKAEMNVDFTVAGLGFFLKSPSSIVGCDGEVPIPFPGRRTDQEAELGVVIGRRAVDVTKQEALDHVFGYTCLLDITVRGSEERSTRKSFPGFTPIGSWITTADEIPDPNALRVRGWVNGNLRQDAPTSDMIYDVAALIEFMSSVIALEPGDVIATGTPAGVGPIMPGDIVRVEIEGVSSIEIPVVDATREPHEVWQTKED